MLRAPSIALALALAAPHAAADIVWLKNGQRLRGEVIARSATSVELRLPSLSTTLAADEVASIETEKPEVYFEEEARAFLKRQVWGEAARFLARGREKCPDHAPLAALADAAASVLAARAAEDELKLARALELLGKARARAPKVDSIAAELARVEQVKGYFDANGSLPGDFHELVGERLVILHHHPLEARGLAAKAEALIDPAIKRVRRSSAHKPPKEAQLVLAVYRDAQAYARAVAKARPHGKLPDRDDGMLLSNSRAATYRAAAADVLAALVERWVVRQMYESCPLWVIEGLVAGGAAKEQEDALRAAAAKLAEGEQLLPLAKLMKVGHYAQLADAGARKAYQAQAASLVRYVAGLPGGIRDVSRAVEEARKMMFYWLLDPRKKHYKLKSYRFEDLIPYFLVDKLPERLGFAKLDELEADYKAWVESGKRKGKSRHR